MGVKYKVTQIWIDVFHSRGGIVKVLIKYLRYVMEGLETRNYRCVSLFAAFLRGLKHWDGYVLDPWIANDTQARLKGKHTKEFTKKISECVHVLKSIMRGQVIDDLCTCLESFQIMSKIVSFVIIDTFNIVKCILCADSPVNEESGPACIAEEVIKTYEFHAKKLYAHGHRSVLTRHVTGDHETFYFHAFRYYVPKMMRLIYRKHKLGIGVMTMDGFEYKNFSSKYVVSTRSNGKGNIVMQSMRVLHLLFKSGYHNVDKEIKRRKKNETETNDQVGTDEPDITCGDTLVDQLIENILEAV